MRHTLLHAAALVMALVAGAARAEAAEEAAAPEAKRPLMLPPLARNMVRVQGTVRPFFNLIGPGGGAIGDLSVEYYFQRPFKLGFELSPFAFVLVPEGPGTIVHARVRGAFSSDYVEVGLGIGGRMQYFGPSGLSVAPAMRLGSLDGLNLRAEMGYSLIRNYYTRQTQFALSHVTGGLDVPVTRRLALTLDGGYGLDLWAYATLGARQWITGRGEPGSLAIGASVGAAWVVDRFPCQYGDIDPCRGAAWGLGPTIAVRVDRRF
ncbi:hypothetical protein [Polyangium jinanense]|uniref:Outer membrane beta-barrel domain-containing protein n=1 Tax=Polyangium jinanense TaxID=2829994 RepID=A0A9X3X4T8_9BACT|nr:hypothetical protein [Polyangium jinanense]MDC3954854.1 hypothetical protein [Polyangium jinanense]MDC3981376.1 hypothetical protein [Polyangium jinanense]